LVKNKKYNDGLEDAELRSKVKVKTRIWGQKMEDTR
jgi:hypothetical protein